MSDFSTTMHSDFTNVEKKAVEIDTEREGKYREELEDKCMQQGNGSCISNGISGVGET